MHWHKLCCTLQMESLFEVRGHLSLCPRVSLSLCNGSTQILQWVNSAKLLIWIGPWDRIQHVSIPTPSQTCPALPLCYSAQHLPAPADTAPYTGNGGKTLAFPLVLQTGVPLQSVFCPHLRSPGIGKLCCVLCKTSCLYFLKSVQQAM